jgi:hypothetical protein
VSRRLADGLAGAEKAVGAFEKSLKAGTPQMDTDGHR